MADVHAGSYLFDLLRAEAIQNRGDIEFDMTSTIRGELSTDSVALSPWCSERRAQDGPIAVRGTMLLRAQDRRQFFTATISPI